MVVKLDAVHARLLRLEEAVSELELLREEATDPKRLSHRWSVERGLHLGAEIILDIGNHVLSATFGVTAESYDDIIHQLGHRGVLSSDLYQRLKGLGKFRNVLVHDYMRLDPTRVDEILADAPETYGTFISEIRGWMEQFQKTQDGEG